MNQPLEPIREHLLELLTRISRTYPEMRMGQLIANLCSMTSEDGDDHIWDIEDRDMEREAENLLVGLEALATALV